MLMYFYGADSYRRQYYLKSQVLNPYRNKYNDLAIRFFDFKENPKETLTNLDEFCKSLSLFSSVKLAIINNPQEAAEGLAAWLKKFVNDKSVVIVLDCPVELGAKFKFLLAPPVKSQAFEVLTGAKLLSYIKQESLSRGLNLNPETIKFLANNFGADSWLINTELDKLALGGKSEVRSLSFDFISLIKALAWGRDLAEKIKSLHRLLEQNDPGQVFNTLAAFVGPKTKVKMADYDILVKSGKLEYPEALFDLIISS